MFYEFETRSEAITTEAFISGLSPLPHIHPHLELIYLTEGSTIATVDNKKFLIEAGDLFLAFPNQIHLYHDQSVTAGYLIIFSPDLFKDLKELFHNKVPAFPIIKSHQLTLDVKDRMSKIVTKIDSDSSFDQIAAKGYLLAFLGEILPLMTFQSNTSDQDSIKKLLRYCSENYTEPLTLDIVSKNLHLNKYYISHIFKERMNISFTEFVNSLRTEHACNLLEKGVNITEAAFSSGFSSIRTFNRVFVQNIKMTPREYIKTQK